MRRILSSIATLALVAGFFVAAPAQAATPWDVTGSYDVAFTCDVGCGGSSGPYVHDMDLVQNSSDAITGTGGGYPANAAHVYTWVIDSGTVSGDTLSFTSHYTATADAVTPLTTMLVSGTIAPDGSMSGVWSDNYQGGVRNGTWVTTAGEVTLMTTVVSGGGHINETGGKGKKLYTFSVNIEVDPDLNESGTFTLVNHTTQTTCNYNLISGLLIVDGQASFHASGSTCSDVNVVVDDNGEPGAGVDKLTVSGITLLTAKLITGGNFEVVGLPESATTTFAATNSTYYNCPAPCASIYATGPISFTWDTGTGNVISGNYDETIGSTVYYNVVDSGSVVGGVVNLTFSRINPNVYGPFTFTGNLTGNVLSGMLDGPYYLEATGTVTP